MAQPRTHQAGLDQVPVIAVASGKGGVGKTTVAVGYPAQRSTGERDAAQA